MHCMDAKKSGIHAATYVLFQYVQEVKGIFLNDRSPAESAVELFLILPPANSPGFSGRSPFPENMAMTG